MVDIEKSEIDQKREQLSYGLAQLSLSYSLNVRLSLYFTFLPVSKSYGEYVLHTNHTTEKHGYVNNSRP